MSSCKAINAVATAKELSVTLSENMTIDLQFRYLSVWGGWVLSFFGGCAPFTLQERLSEDKNSGKKFSYPGLSWYVSASACLKNCINLHDFCTPLAGGTKVMQINILSSVNHCEDFKYDNLHWLKSKIAWLLCPPPGGAKVIRIYTTFSIKVV